MVHGRVLARQGVQHANQYRLCVVLTDGLPCDVLCHLDPPLELHHQTSRVAWILGRLGHHAVEIGQDKSLSGRQAWAEVHVQLLPCSVPVLCLDPQNYLLGFSGGQGLQSTPNLHRVTGHPGSILALPVFGPLLCDSVGLRLRLLQEVPHSWRDVVQVV